MATVASGAGRDSSRRRGTGRMNNMNNPRGPPVTNVRRNGAGSYQQNVPSDGVYGNERMIHALMNMLGYTVTLTVKNNSVYEGILNSISPKMEINLQFVNLIQNCANGQSSRSAERGESIKSMIFNPTDIVSFCAANVDYDTNTRDNFTDAAISRNGQSVERDLKELEPWVAETDDDSLTLDSGTNGWDAHDMFKRNAEQFDVKSTYDENLSQYTTPLVRKNDREYRQKEEEAERMAREIESTESYRAHSALENGDRDEETKFSSVVRPDESETQNTGRYVPPHNRQNPNPMTAPNRPPNYRGPLPNTHQPPLPQREKRERDRGWENPASRQSMQPQGGPSPVTTQGPGPQPNMPPAIAQQRRDLADIRMNGGDNRERKSAVETARNFNKPGGSMNQGAMNQSSINQGSMNQGNMNHGGINQGGMNQRPPHHVQPPMPSGPSMQSSPPVATVKPQPAQHQPATSTPVPSNSQLPPPPHLSMSGPVPAPTTQPQPPPAVPSEKPEPRALSPQSQSQPPPAERKSRDKVEDLKEFGKKFKLPDNVDDRKAERGQGEKRPEVEEKKEEEKTEVKVNENVIKSSLNPNAKEFKPAFNAPTVKSVPPPSPTPPPPRQSPVVHPPPAMMPIQSNMYAPNPYIKVVLPSTQSGPQRQTKRAVVSVHPDHAQLAAHHATGQPLLAQATTLPGQQFVYQIPPGLQQGGQHSFPMLARMVPPTSMHMSHQGSGMDPNQASGQTAHATQQLFGTFPLGKNDSFLPPKNFWFAPGHAPIPAHMHPGAAGMSHPQPAHTHTHMQHHQQHHQVPGPPGPGPQPQSGQITPHPSASPVQHMGPNGHAQPGPQPHHAHTQGAPPTSGTPQPSMNYSQGMGMQGHPPQLQPTHAHPAHSHAGHNNPNPQGLHPVSMSMTYMPHTMQASSLSQAGASGGGGGPAPAHVQHGTHAQMGQTHQVVLMPQPPPHQVNQVAAMSNHHHHHHSGQYPQHITVTGHGQVHSGGQGPHLMPGNMPTAIPVSGTGLAGMHPGQMHHAAYGPPNTAQYKHAVSHQGGHYQGQ